MVLFKILENSKILKRLQYLGEIIGDFLNVWYSNTNSYYFRKIILMSSRIEVQHVCTYCSKVFWPKLQK